MNADIVIQKRLVRKAEKNLIKSDRMETIKSFMGFYISENLRLFTYNNHFKKYTYHAN